MAEHGTFTAAAASLSYTQSAVSRQIAAIERVADAKLLDQPQEATVRVAEALRAAVLETGIAA